jgi:hypothetical protein
MQTALDQFRSNIVYVRNIGGLYTSIGSITTAALDLSDLLRTQLVMCVSALDHYIHEITRIGMLQALDDQRPRTSAFLRYNVSVDSVLQTVGSVGGNAWIETEIRARHGYLSFQQPDKIADAIRLISPIDLWNSLGASLGDNPKNLKTRLRLIIERRNKIVHEADIDPTYPGSGARWPITDILVNDAVNFIERLCETLHLLLLAETK